MLSTLRTAVGRRHGRPTRPIRRRRLLVGAAALSVPPLALVAYTLAAHRPSRRERAAPMPGDAMLPRPMFATTQAVTIDAPPERVWPWIAQMGAGRAGWYSYDAVDNGGTPSATALLDDYRHLAVGDVLPAVPGATEAFVVLAVDAPRDLVLGGPPDSEGGQRATWEFLLLPLDGGECTRLVVRGRVGLHWLDGDSAPRDAAAPRFAIERLYAFMAHLPKPALAAFAGFGHRVMQNEQLRGIKRRAEG